MFQKANSTPTNKNLFVASLRSKTTDSIIGFVNPPDSAMIKLFTVPTKEVTAQQIESIAYKFESESLYLHVIDTTVPLEVVTADKF